MNKYGNNVYILGAGFSAAAGFPLVNNFLERMRDVRDLRTNSLPEQADHAIDVVLDERANLSMVREKIRIDLDNIEELFSLIEANAENDKKVKLGKAIRQAIAATLLIPDNPKRQVPSNAIPKPTSIASLLHHARHDRVLLQSATVDVYELFSALIAGRFDRREDWEEDCDTIISFNYDTVLDDCLTEVGASPNYGIEGAKYDASIVPSENSPMLLKIHGSINWNLKNGHIEVYKDPVELLANNETPLLVPPTWNKGLSNDFAKIWSEAIRAIQNADRLIVIGYSMPLSDLHFKYFLSAGLKNNHSLRSFVTINPTDLSKVYDSFFDSTFFAKRKQSVKTTLEDFLGNFRNACDYWGRGSLLVKGEEKNTQPQRAQAEL